MNLSALRTRSAFMLSEVMVSLAIFGITAGVSLTALIHMNNRAFVTRCQTGASTLAQNQIDLILSEMPFNPQKGQVPPSLTVGITDRGSASNPTLAVYTDPKAGAVGDLNQIDQMTQQADVKGWMRTEVANIGATYGSVNMNIYRATVTVFYSYRGKNYSVSMCTMRASDI